MIALHAPVFDKIGECIGWKKSAQGGSTPRAARVLLKTIVSENLLFRARQEARRVVWRHFTSQKEAQRGTVSFDWPEALVLDVKQGHNMFEPSLARTVSVCNGRNCVRVWSCFLSCFLSCVASLCNDQQHHWSYA